MSSYRRKALEEYGERCMYCGSGEKIEVHHKNGDRNDNRLRNLIPLCKKCHRKLHREGLDGLEDQLLPVSERSQLDTDTTTYQFDVGGDTWARWKDTVPRSKTLEERLRELVVADAEGRVEEKRE